MRWSPACLLLTACLHAPHADACAECGARIRAEVRAGIFDASFTRTCVLIALPFALLGGMVAAIHCWPTRAGSIPR